MNFSAVTIFFGQGSSTAGAVKQSLSPSLAGENEACVTFYLQIHEDQRHLYNVSPEGFVRWGREASPSQAVKRDEIQKFFSDMNWCEQVWRGHFSSFSIYSHLCTCKINFMISDNVDTFF